MPVRKKAGVYAEVQMAGDVASATKIASCQKGWTGHDILPLKMRGFSAVRGWLSWTLATRRGVNWHWAFSVPSWGASIIDATRGVSNAIQGTGLGITLGLGG